MFQVVLQALRITSVYKAAKFPTSTKLITGYGKLVAGI